MIEEPFLNIRIIPWNDWNDSSMSRSWKPQVNFWSEHLKVVGLAWEQQGHMLARK